MDCVKNLCGSQEMAVKVDKKPLQKNAKIPLLGVMAKL